jgi:RNA polymerase sigma-70 factor, ECF subfamily
MNSADKKIGDLYREYYDKIFNLCLRMSGNYDEALDLTQESFIKIYKKLDSFNNESGIYTWIYKIAMNTCIDNNRKLALIWKSLERSFSGKTREPTCQSPEVDFIAKTEGMAILKKLSPKERGVLLLKIYMGFSYREIAEIMNISIESVGVFINRARKKASTFLQNSG